MKAASCLVWVSRIEATRAGRLVSCHVELYAVAVGDVDGEPLLIDTRTGEPWAGSFTPEEQAEAGALLERAREMRRLDEQRWPVAA